MEPLSIAAKAAGALSDSGKAQATGFLRAVLHAPAEALGGILADAISERRHANLIKIAGRAQERLSKAGVSAKQVPLSVIHPAIEAASLEEDPDLQEVWSNLLANAADSRANNSVPPSFPLILRELSARDVKFLDALFQMALDELKRRQTAQTPWLNSLGSIEFQHSDAYDVFEKAGLARFKRSSATTYEQLRSHDEDMAADHRDADMCMDTLRRHELFIESIDMDSEEKMLQGQSGPITYKIPLWRYHLKITYSFSRLGVAFVTACRPPEHSAKS